ncbi:A24 family peptidase [Brevibacillus choshinensis]|uniref:Prepilin peptidase n=1 Tax=Brevibacillus choshinensis TaxID=54911 RepID=A0ABX7FQ38_BRECH|nr:A24 family peptidase [Brevibacillus choshinensis]QRG67838.1 prepilin peptidase [Brevibacillus choshinensis]
MNHAVLLTVLAIAACFDWRQRKVPNALTLPAMAVGLWYQYQTGTAWTAWGGLGGAFLLTFGPVACKGMGMGDQKLLMAVGAWSSWTVVFSLFLYAILLCVLTTFFVPRTWSRLRANLLTLATGWKAHREMWLPEREQSAYSLPFGVFLLAAYGILHFQSAAGSIV